MRPVEAARQWLLSEDHALSEETKLCRISEHGIPCGAIFLPPSQCDAEQTCFVMLCSALQVTENGKKKVCCSF